MKQQTIQRVEKKYVLSTAVYETIFTQIAPYLMKDMYPTSHIYNLYLDGDDYHMITTSMQKPLYKEKLRLRSYAPMSLKDNSMVFLEIKKKYRQTVCKRRLELPLQEAMYMLERHDRKDSQIARELCYALAFHAALPKVYIAYDRCSYVGKQEPGLRITFDKHIRGRMHKLNLQDEEGTFPLFEKDQVLMEIKACGSYPFWLVEALSKLQIYPTSFSKVANIVMKEAKQKGGRQTCLQAF